MTKANLTDAIRLAKHETTHGRDDRIPEFAFRRRRGRVKTGLIAAGSTAAFALFVTCASAPTAQELYVYPQKGQSAELQSRDRHECHQWAAGQTGFDPSRQQSGAATTADIPPPQPEAPQGGLARGAARGAVVGVVGGAIAGDAGKGAAIGAGTGALIGGMRRRDQQAREQQAQQNYERQRAAALEAQGAESSKQRGAYNRAMTACLQARGYSVN